MVPLDAGLKLLGRAGRWSIAALDVETGDSSAVQSTNLFAGRTTYDVNEHLRLGALATSGDPDGVEDNALAGLDALWQTSSFRGDKTLSFGAWAAQSGGDLVSGQRSG